MGVDDRKFKIVLQNFCKKSIELISYKAIQFYKMITSNFMKNTRSQYELHPSKETKLTSS